MKTVVEIKINAAPAQIFSALLNPDIKVKWDKNFVSSTFEYDNLLKGEPVSLKFREIYKESYGYKSYIVELLDIENRLHYSFRYADKAMSASFEYLLVEMNEGCHLIVTTETSYNVCFSRLLFKSCKKAGRKCITEELKSLKRFVEQNKLFML